MSKVYMFLLSGFLLLFPVLLLPSGEAKLPIVFHDSYDISLAGFEKLHPFDTKKYGKVAASLIQKLGIRKDQFYQPTKVSDEDLKLVHSARYLSSLSSSIQIAKIAEVPLICWIPNFLLQWYLLDPMRYATAGTVLGAELALTHGWAINLSGGYHHAKGEEGGGFCFLADIPLAIRKLRLTRPQMRVLVLDLDAHQGNGHESVLAGDKLSHIFDIYVDDNYPWDYEARKGIQFNYPVEPGIQDEEYLRLLRENLPAAVEHVHPDLIIYNAGTDVYRKDPIGRMSMSKQGIIERDFFVFNQACVRNIPILMVLSGGYTSESAGIIADSLERILREIIKLKASRK
jgi:histone deacetylase 11